MEDKNKIIIALKKATNEDSIFLETPEIESHGDYATNIALILGKKEKKNPQKVSYQKITI